MALFDGLFGKKKSLLDRFVGLFNRDLLDPLAPTTPTPTPDWDAKRNELAQMFREKQVLGSQTTQSPTNEGFFDYEPYRVSGEFQPSQPPPYIANELWKTFPEEATKSALVAATENQGFDPRAVGPTKDIGIMQINPKTFMDYQRRMPERLKKLGLNSIDDLFDPIKNILMAKLIHNYEGWGAWYGPPDKGFDIKSR